MFSRVSTCAPAYEPHVDGGAVMMTAGFLRLMRSIVSTRVVFLSVLLAGGMAVAEPEPPAARLVVDVAQPQEASERWFAAALEETVGRELSRFRGVAMAEKIDAARCKSREARCLVDAYRAAGVQVVVLGRLRGKVLEYEVYPTWRAGRAFDGAIAVEGVDAATVRRHIGGIARPIVQRGGLLDERGAAAITATTTPRRRSRSRSRSRLWRLGSG